MAIARWDEKYATGNLPIDGQHKKLFELVNGLHDALLQGHGRDHMGPTLRSLASYTVDHFATEERLMTQLAYPGFQEHRRKHEELVGKVTHLMADFDAGKLTLPLTLARFLADWITHHIQDEDLKMTTWLRGREVD